MPLKLRTAVIGVGSMGINHARIYSEISNLVAVVDKNMEIGKVVSKQFKTQYFSDFLKMLKEVAPEAVSIVVPTSMHSKIAVECLKRKIPVLVEKPIADTIKDAKLIIKKAKENNIFFMVGHIERFNPVVRKVKEIIDKGDLGKITCIMARRVGGFPPRINDVGIAVDLAIHDIDIVNFLLSEEPRSVIVNSQRNHIENRSDSVEFFLKYKRTSAFIQANWITPVKIRKLNITGTEGYLEADYVNQTIEFYKSIYEKFKVASPNFSDYILKFSDPNKIMIKVSKKEPLKEEIIFFLDCIKNHKIIDQNYALNALKIALSE